MVVQCWPTSATLAQHCTNIGLLGILTSLGAHACDVQWLVLAEVYVAEEQFPAVGQAISLTGNPGLLPPIYPSLSATRCQHATGHVTVWPTASGHLVSLRASGSSTANNKHSLNASTMLGSVVDDGPSLHQHRVNVSCLLGCTRLTR